MTTSNDLVALEERGWQALSSDGASAADFYDQVLDDTVVMLLPGGIALTDRDEIIHSMGGQPWASFALEDPQVHVTTSDTAVVHYGVVARRDNAPEYSALVSSLYVHRPDGWKLAFHQQTPR